MEKFVSLLKSELQKKAWNSVLQLCVGGVVIYVLSITAGPAYGCGAGNAQYMDNVFQCIRGEMATTTKVFITAGIILASLCWARAAFLYERKRAV